MNNVVQEQGGEHEVKPLSSNEEVDSVEEVVIGNIEDPVICIMHCLLLIRQESQAQRHAIIRTSSIINKKVCNVIVNNGSRENIVSKPLVKACSFQPLLILISIRLARIRRGLKLK